MPCILGGQGGEGKGDGGGPVPPVDLFQFYMVKGNGVWEDKCEGGARG